MTLLFICLVVRELRKQKMCKENFKFTHSAPQSESYHASNKVNKSFSQMLTLGLLQAKADFLCQVAPWNIFIPWRRRFEQQWQEIPVLENPWEISQCVIHGIPEFYNLSINNERIWCCRECCWCLFYKMHKQMSALSLVCSGREVHDGPFLLPYLCVLWWRRWNLISVLYSSFWYNTLPCIP